MTPTTTTAIKAAARTAIEAITPRFEAFRECVWRHLEPPWAGVGGECRAYWLRASVAEPCFGWYSNGEAYCFDLHVVTSYGFVRGVEFADLLTLDGVDLRAAIDNLREPTEPGIYSVEYRGVAEDLPTDGHPVVIAHRFYIEYLQETGLH